MKFIIVLSNLLATFTAIVSGLVIPLSPADAATFTTLTRRDGEEPRSLCARTIDTADGPAIDRHRTHPNIPYPCAHRPPRLVAPRYLCASPTAGALYIRLRTFDGECGGLPFIRRAAAASETSGPWLASSVWRRKAFPLSAPLGQLSKFAFAGASVTRVEVAEDEDEHSRESRSVSWLHALSSVFGHV
ncbi:hypothetical protein C8J57DRAFT_1726890 [Mycena rebaudengoi]|nr:hypothetical protein C8J57DRAFT_1726890 [Mycena rebaudengoi]